MRPIYSETFWKQFAVVQTYYSQKLGLVPEVAYAHAFAICNGLVGQDIMNMNLAEFAQAMATQPEYNTLMPFAMNIVFVLLRRHATS